MQNTAENLGVQPAGPDDLRVVRKACDQCRLRKIRCDKDWPCSNCRTSERSCTSSGAGQRPREPRQRVLISSQYERKIDQIEVRLGNIETLLKNLSTGHHQQPASSLTPGTGGSIPTTASTADFESSDEESAFGGDGGLTAQTAFASDFLEHAVQRTSLREVSPSMWGALNNLRQLVAAQKRQSVSHGPRFPFQRPVPAGGICKLPMPPVGSIIPLLKESKTAPPTVFSFTCTLLGLRDFSSLCRMIYFPTENFSVAQFAIVNAGLYNLFMEKYSLAQDQVIREEYISYTQLCQANFETSLANLPLFMSPKVENVQALVLGAIYAIDVSRPSVAWHLNSTAALLCQTAGFHRAECIEKDTAEVAQVKSILWWQVYTLEKGLSLRLGRSSNIKECDISIKRELDFTGYANFEAFAVPKLWLETCSLQAHIYEQLYSPAALKSSPFELGQRARAIAAECQSLEPRIAMTRDETSAMLKSLKSSEIFEIFISGDEVQFHVTMTLVYRAIPAPQGSASRFCNECLESARKAMQTHMRSLSMMKYGSYAKSILIHWNLMLVPFAPFFVLFCHIIETLSHDDLKILQEFVASFEGLREASETIEKLHRMFQVMHDVAILYVEAKSQQQQDENMIPIGDEFDMYLSQLGFMPVDDQAMDHSTDASHSVPQTAQMPDWFSGSRNMFGLLEEDLSLIDEGWGMQGGPM